MMRAIERNKLEVGIDKIGETPIEHEQNKKKMWNSDIQVARKLHQEELVLVMCFDIPVMVE
jgi:hypothetical protein